jgi:hypothetical protein
MRRREFMAFLGSAAAALPLTASAQQSAPPSPVRQDWLDRRREPALEPELPIVDPHHHLWVRPGWRYMLDDFLADVGTGHNVVATVFVQANSMYRDAGPIESRAREGHARQRESALLLHDFCRPGLQDRIGVIADQLAVVALAVVRPP